MDALVARDCSVLTPLVVCHAISRRSRALFSGLETPWCHCLSLASRQNWDRHAEQWVRIMVSRVGFRHIQHVRLNRSPTNRGQRMSGSIFKVAVQTYWALYGDVPQYLYGSLHQSPTSRPDKDFGLPLRTIYVFLLSDCLLLDVVLSLSLTPVSGTLFLPTSLQHLLCSLSENV